MMQIIEPKPFTFEGDTDRAVLLLHGFTGNSADVRMLGRFLETKGYTSHAPIYRGHGKSPEELLKYTPDHWVEDSEKAFRHLQKLGYEKIAVVGLSLGGVLSLRLATMEDVVGVVPMCTPMFSDNDRQLNGGFKQFAEEYKKLSQKSDAEIKQEINAIFEKAPNTFKEIGQLITKTRENLSKVIAPIKVVQARKDEMINPESAPYIYEHVQSTNKKLSWYENSGHAITFGPERKQLQENIYKFLHSLDW
ncbi:MAG TPA: alpha/beta fold hydrolase [Bacillota bacterium]|nr:alpha/beta fold hydrolase [Bacillota bacterium]